MNKEVNVKTFELENGDKCWIIEKFFENETVNIDNSKIKINAYRKPISMTSIFITKDDEYVGHISANIYEDKKASLIMSGIRNIELPEELAFCKEKIEKIDVALLVDEKYRRKGKATELINLMLNYLSRKEIEDLSVDSISDEIAMQTYLKTGAEKIDDKNAIYRNIKRIIDAPKTQYQQLVESIDDFELCKIFVERATRNVTPDVEKAIKKYESETYCYPLQTRLSNEDTLELARKFFESVDKGLYEKYNNVVNGSNPNAILQMEEFNGKGPSVDSPEKLPVTVYVPIRGDIRQLYELVHECTHTFDIDNGENPTRKVLGEVAPQCMERLLDDFLLGMSDEDMQKYAFDRETLGKDIKDRKIATFLSRFHNSQDLYRGSRNRVIDSRYMLAQIYSAHFNKFNKDGKKNKLVAFIECVKNDEFEKANSCFELSIDKNARLNGLYREAYVEDAISEAMNLVIPKNQEAIENQQRKLDGEDMVR